MLFSHSLLLKSSLLHCIEIRFLHSSPGFWSRSWSALALRFYSGSGSVSGSDYAAEVRPVIWPNES